MKLCTSTKAESDLGSTPLLCPSKSIGQEYLKGFPIEIVIE
jgi:hypothetical protein